MGSFKEIEGDLIQMTLEGKFEVIIHGCNCYCTMGSGIAVPMKNNFGVDKYPLEAPEYKGDYNKLGQIEGKYNPKLMTHIVNCYTQYNYNRKADPEAVHLDYEALAMCLKKLNHYYRGLHIGLPLIGCGRAGGNWSRVKSMVKNYLSDMHVTIVHRKDY